MYDLPELQLIRAGLDTLTIRGADAKFLAQLQQKIEDQIINASAPPKTSKS
jgi:hypothetical protein